MPRPDRHFDWQPLTPHAAPPVVLADPRLRLRLIYGAFVAMLVLVLVRAAVLEATGGAAFRQSTDRSHSVTEALPALRGRLLSRDGVVLAGDQSIASLAVDYRYLEDPTSEAWLNTLARRRLKASAARDPKARAAEVARIKVEIAEMNRRLAGLCGMPMSQWQARCRAVQRQVETVAENVNDRRQDAYVRRVAHAEPQQPSGVMAIIRQAAIELFTPPAELPPPRIAIREQQQAHVMARGLSLDVVAEIETRAKDFPGVEIRREVRRSYPGQSLAANLVGYVGSAAETDRSTRPIAAGRTGAERAAEPWLCGKPGVMRRSIDSRGQLVESHVEREAQPGRDVVLTLDAGLQRRAERLLDEFQDQGVTGTQPATKPRPRSAGGAVLVMDVHSGAVLAAATAPRYDLNVLLGGAPREIDALMSDARHPLLDRTAQMAIAPGSVFKTLTALALLESDSFDPQTRFECRGYLHRPDAQRCMIFRHFGIGHGPIGLRDALAQSCNVYFQHHAVSLGAQLLTNEADRLGFGRRTGCDWCQDSAGKLHAKASGGPTIAARRCPPPVLVGDRNKRDDDPTWTSADTEAIAIGQGRLSTTPLQIARLMAAVANGGRLVTPHILADVGLAADATSASTEIALPQHASRQVVRLSPEKVAALRRGLEAVVADSDGTGYNTVRVASVAIAGKTGTAETGGGLPDHAWFAGYAPAEAPRVAVVVALEHGGSGAEAAGPIARRVVEHLAERGYFSGRNEHVTSVRQ